MMNFHGMPIFKKKQVSLVCRSSHCRYSWSGSQPSMHCICTRLSCCYFCLYFTHTLISGFELTTLMNNYYKLIEKQLGANYFDILIEKQLIYIDKRYRLLNHCIERVVTYTIK